MIPAHMKLALTGLPLLKANENVEKVNIRVVSKGTTINKETVGFCF